MQQIGVKRKDGTEELISVYDPAELDLDALSDQFIISPRGRGHDKLAYLTDFATFDIETTTIPGKKVKGEWIETPWAFMYQWQFCIGGKVVFGKRWEEFWQLLRSLKERFNLKEKKRLVIFVHNLGFEFAFMYPFLTREFGEMEVFATKPHQPVKVTLPELGIEFRCSWKLTNMNLYMLTKTELHCPYLKAFDDLDYKKIRTPKTPLTAAEAAYCVIDVLGLYYALKSKMQSDKDTIASLPLTSTGYPRRLCRRNCRKDKDYREKVFKKCMLTLSVYLLLLEAKRGGNTHANRYFANNIYLDVESWDEVSEYPAAMLLFDYPMGQFSPYGEVKSIAELDKLCASYACLFRISFNNLKIKPGVPMPYIPIDKLVRCPNKKKFVKGDNGRVLEVEGLCSITINEIDWEIIKRQYDWDPGVIIEELHIANKAPLPEPIRETILKFFATKCELKFLQIKDAEKRLKARPDNKSIIDELNLLNYLYGKVKNMLNGIFGMIYTDPCRLETKIDASGKWSEALPAGKTLADLLDKFNKSRNSFLCYAWGVWVTSYGRKMLDDLQSCTVDAHGHCWCLYSDTDSAKSQYWNKEKLDALIARMKALSDERGAYWIAPDGHKEYMGYPEHDSTAKRFKTLGAKKYAYEDENGDLHVTISGVANVHKPGDKLGMGARELMEHGGLDALEVGFVFEEAGGACVWYGHAEPHIIKVRGCEIETASYAAITDGSYTVGMTEEYKKLLGCL